MTPKEKAIELVDRYLSYVNCWGDDGNADYEMADRYAKQCGLIAVDEILNIDVINNAAYEMYSVKSYWKEVKREIEKL